MTVAAFAAVFLAGCAALPQGGDADVGTASSDAPSAAPIATSPDQTISVTLPAGWRDFSTEYLEGRPTSLLSALWGAGESADDRGAPIASVSTRPASTASVSAEVISASDALEWRKSMGGEITDEGSFTTKEGGDGYWNRIEGTEQGAKTTVISVSILSNGRSAKISIKTHPETPGTGEALLDALKTVTLAPAAPTEARTGEVIGGVYTDGSVEMTVPTQWNDPVGLDATDSAEVHLLGMWILGMQAPERPAYVGITVNDAVPGLDRAQRHKEEWGEAGSIHDGAGGEVLMVSVTDVVYPNGATGVIGCAGSPEDVPAVTQQCNFIFTLGDYFVSAQVVGVALYPEAVDQASEAIASLRLP